MSIVIKYVEFIKLIQVKWYSLDSRQPEHEGDADWGLGH